MSDTLEIPNDRRERYAWFVWGFLVFVGVAIYELFRQPAFLGVSLSLKFGISDALTAFWLRRRDPNRRRGSTNFFIYLGYALWKVSMAAGVISFALPMLHGIFVGGKMGAGNNNNHPLFAIFAGSCSTAMLGMWASAAVTSVGLVKALRHRFQLWLHDSVASARVRNDWPPEYGDRNRLDRVALPSAMFVVGVLVALLNALVVVLVQEFLPAAGKEWFIAQAIISVVGFAAGSLLLVDEIRKRLVASYPLAAWNRDNVIN